jgi:nuclear transport factor 2 (NTF2) superfamily protein
MEHLSDVHAVPGVGRTDPLRCPVCPTLRFGNLKVFSQHITRCLDVAALPYSCSRCGAGSRDREARDDHLCADVTVLTPDALLSTLIKTPFYVMLKGATTNPRITYGAELRLDAVATCPPAHQVLSSSMIIANVAFESPAMSLLPLEDLARTQLAVSLVSRPACTIWVLLAATLRNKLRENLELPALYRLSSAVRPQQELLQQRWARFHDTLATTTLSPNLVEVFGERNLRNGNWITGEYVDALGGDAARRLVYEVDGGHGAVRPLDDLMDDISFAVGTVRRGPGAAAREERLLHTGLLPPPPPPPPSHAPNSVSVAPDLNAPPPIPTTTDTTDLHALMAARSDLNTSREVDQMSAVYEFFQVFGHFWYNAFGYFFIDHNRESVGATLNSKWSYEHACRAYEELDALTLADTVVLPRAIEAEGWTYDKNKRALRRERRWYSFMELMRIELKREHVGSTYLMKWITDAPVSQRKRRRIRDDDGGDDEVGVQNSPTRPRLVNPL